MKRLTLSPLRSSCPILQILEMLTRWVSGTRLSGGNARKMDCKPSSHCILGGKLAWTVNNYQFEIKMF